MQHHHKQTRWDRDMSGHDDDIALTKDDIKILLTKVLGISIQKDQLRILVDVLDKTNDQIISWQDFQEFTGGDRRGMREDASRRLNQWCLWRTTCRLTGMPHAYRGFSSRMREKTEKEYGLRTSCQVQTERQKSSPIYKTRCKNEKRYKVSNALREFNINS